MKKRSMAQNYMKQLAVWIAIILTMLTVIFQPERCKASMKSPPPEKIKAIIIGDRVVDIAYNLGVLPEAMSVRGALWPMASKLKTASQILGCPRFIVESTPTIVPETAKRLGIKRIIIEKHPQFWLYRPEVKPANVVPLLKGMDLTIEYVDFAQGLESAIHQTAKLIGRESKADALIERYNKTLGKTEMGLPKAPLGKKVIIFSGIYQSTTGKTFLRVEAPGGYSDRFLLEQLGCVNVGDCFKPSTGKAAKGHYMVRKKQGRMAFDPMIAVDPDVIIMTGDALSVQKSLASYLKINPELAQVKALKNAALYSLPFYADSSVIEYPAILAKWVGALSE
jgi:ABC-type Fe3+-hydroxamate transport system substrate-binding protein